MPSLSLEEMTKLRTNTMKVINHMLVCQGRLESTMPSEPVADEISQLRKGANVVFSRALFNEINLLFSRVSE